MENRALRLFILFICTICSYNTWSQEWKDLGTDELFEVARQEAFNGQRPESREKLQFILQNSPTYADVRILLARTYAWDGEYDKATEQLKIVLESDQKNKDAINALIDANMWADQYEEALIAANYGIKSYSNFEDFLYKKASILNSLERFEEAVGTVNQLLTVNPSSERAISLRNEIKISQMRYTASLSAGVDLFSKNYDAALYSSIQLGRSNNWGSSIARLNYSRRFNTSGLQGEIDLYPTLFKGVYGYLNYGFSTNKLFPDHRLGAEVFIKLPYSTETSVGARYLTFGPNSNVLMYTGSFGWYYKNLWLSLRPFITPDEAAGTSVSMSLTMRRYFSNPKNYIELSGGLGYSPEIRTLQAAEGLTNKEFYTLKSQRIGMSAQKILRYNLVGSLRANLSHQQLSYFVGYVWITSISGNLAFNF